MQKKERTVPEKKDIYRTAAGARSQKNLCNMHSYNDKNKISGTKPKKNMGYKKILNCKNGFFILCHCVRMSTGSIS